MANKTCMECKYVRLDNHGMHNCMNPINDVIFDWFNTSTGDVIRDVRRASQTYEKNYCDEFIAKKRLHRHQSD